MPQASSGVLKRRRSPLGTSGLRRRFYCQSGQEFLRCQVAFDPISGLISGLRPEKPGIGSAAGCREHEIKSLISVYVDILSVSVSICKCKSVSSSKSISKPISKSKSMYREQEEGLDVCIHRNLYLFLNLNLNLCTESKR